MQNFLFKCPSLGLMVQGSVDASAVPPEGTLIPYECPGCGRIHLVDPRKQELAQASNSSEPPDGSD